MMRTHWILVADAGSARVLVEENNNAGFWLLRQLGNPDGRARTQELVSDEAGRVYKGGRGIMSAMDPRTDPHEEQAKRFARQLCELLESGASAEEFDRVTLVAPPHFLGLLRKSLGAKTEERLHSCVSKDLTHEDLPQLVKHLQSILEMQDRVAPGTLAKSRQGS